MYNVKIIQNIELYYILIQNDCVIVDVIYIVDLYFITMINHETYLIQLNRK